MSFMIVTRLISGASVRKWNGLLTCPPSTAPLPERESGSVTPAAEAWINPPENWSTVRGLELPRDTQSIRFVGKLKSLTRSETAKMIDHSSSNETFVKAEKSCSRPQAFGTVCKTARDIRRRSFAREISIE